MQQIHLQPYLPGQLPTEVMGTVSISVSVDGVWTVGHEVRGLVDDDVLAIGVGPPCSANEALSVAQGLVSQLYRMLPTLVDAPPFD